MLIALGVFCIGIFWAYYKAWRVIVVPFCYLANRVDQLLDIEPSFTSTFEELYQEPVNVTIQGMQVFIWPAYLVSTIVLTLFAAVVLICLGAFNFFGRIFIEADCIEA